MTSWLTRLLACTALVLPTLAAAVAYDLPGSLPPGCTRSGSNYTCPALSLGYNDSLTVSSPKPATLTVSGDFSSNTSQINAAGNAGDLTLNISGTLALGYNARITANVTAGAVTDGSGNVLITGNLASSGGNISLGYQTSVTGTVSTSGSGTISTAQAGTIGGNLSAGTGSITVGETGTVNGSITSSGNITLSQSAVVAGNVTTGSGTVNVGYQARINGNLGTSGAITLAQESRVAGNITGGTGNVSVGYAATVTGTLTTSSGSISFAQNAVASSCAKSTGSASITLGYQSRINSVCCGGSCGNSCVVNNSTYTMPPACTGSTPAVHHYELALPSASVACQASTVTVTACADASSPCSNPVTGFSGQTAALSTSAGTLGATTVTFNANGVASTTLSHGAASNGSTATVTLSGESSTAATARRCCADGTSCSAANSCSTSFNTAGFIIAASANGATATLPTQTAGASSGSWVLRAVKTNTTTRACEAALSGATTVNWGVQCNDPATCSSGNRMTVTGSSAVAVAGNANGGSASSTAVPMTFDANGNAPFSFNYADVGRVTLLASKTAGGTLLAPLTGSSNAFVVKPAGFVLSAIRCTSYTAGDCATSAIASPGNNPGAASATGSAFLPAGKPFSATVTAVDANGNATPNYGREAAPEGVSLGATLVLPAGGNAPALTNPAAFGSFSGGIATGSTFAWPEVGIITLTPSVADGSYLGAGNVTGTASGNVGRFTPAGFALGSPSITHRADQSCATASPFTYLDEAFQLGFTLTARSAAGATTQNYTGSFARLDLGTAANFQLAGIAGTTMFKTGNARLALGSSAGTWSAGIASVTLTARALRATTPDGPFDTAAFGIAPVDLDGTAMLSPDLDTDSPANGLDSVKVGGTIPLRHGRLRLQNAMGPQGRALNLPLTAQYWTGTAFTTNTLDSCTRIGASHLSFGNLRNVTAANAAMVGGPSTVTAGVGRIALAPPGSSGRATYDVALALDSATPPTDASCFKTAAGWTPAKAATAGANLAALRGAWCGSTAASDPGARATWGLYRGADGVLYQRENY